MKVLLDHNLSKRIRHFLPDHFVRTAWQEGWSRLVNGDSIRQAELSGYDVLVTADQDIWYQQNNLQRSIALVVLTSNRWKLIDSRGETIRSAVDQSLPGSYKTVYVPLPSKSW